VPISLLLLTVVPLFPIPYSRFPFPAAAQTTPDRKAEADRLKQQGIQQYQKGQFREALATFQQVLEMPQAIKPRSGKSTTFENHGFNPNGLERQTSSLEVYHQVDQVSEERTVKDPTNSTVKLSNYCDGWDYVRREDYPKAIRCFKEALIAAKESNNQENELSSLYGLGWIYDDLGNYQEALDSYRQALKLADEIDDRRKEADLLNLIAWTYYNLGQYQLAIRFNQQSIVVSQNIGYRSRVGYALMDIGLAYQALKLHHTSIEFISKALFIAKETNNLELKAFGMRDLGRAYKGLGEYEKAVKYYQESIALSQTINRYFWQAVGFGSLGEVYLTLGEYQKAYEVYQQSLTISQEKSYRALEAQVFRGIGDLLTQQNQPSVAIVFYKYAVNITEAIRKDIRGLPREQQQSYTETVASTYRKLADLLLKQNRILEAQQVLDLLKSQELNDYLRNVRGGGAPLYELPPEQEILKKYNALQQSAIQLGQELTQLRQIPAASRTTAQQERIRQLVQLQEALNQQFNQFTERPDVVALVQQLSSNSLRQTIDLSSLDALRDDLRQLNAVLLYPLVLEDRLELVITTPDSPPLRRTVKVKRQELNRAIADFRSSLQDPRDPSRVKTLAHQLYTWLIQPLEADLKQAKAQAIIYAPDAQLRYIPLAALYDGNQWLVQRFRINNITAKSFTDFKTQPIHTPRVLAGAFVTGQYQFQVGDRRLAFAGLPFAGKEVKTLATLLPNTTQLIDRAFSLDATTTQMQDYNIIHLATHATFVPGAATNSFIVFGNGDKATLKDIESWTLNKVDLVVLSACETGLGGQLGNGEEILGLGYQFQNRGARAAIASLWAVDDGGTQVLMDAFYANLKQSMTKAEALRRAQIALITGTYSNVGGKRAEVEVTGSGKPRSISMDSLKHPYYWAPFILIGNGL
jgi:CHAT domain-containing protein/tetratricopeptide (TPR) repeat protein